MGSYKEDSKKIGFYTKNSIKCKCGHTIFLGSREKIICSWCGQYIFKNEKIKFIYRIGEALKK
jgi:ribosomal protein S27E